MPLLSRMLTSLLALLLIGNVAAAALLHLPGASAGVEIPALGKKKALYLRLDEAARQLPMTVLRDTTAGVSILCTAYDCVPVYDMDETDVQIQDNALFVNAATLAAALGCTTRVSKNDVFLNCPQPLDTLKIGSEVGRRAPGFRLKSTNDSLPNSVPSIFSTDVLAKSALLLVFVRSGDWDTAGKFLLRNLQGRLDTLHGLGVDVAVVHGYEPRAAAKWANTLGLTLPLLSDEYSAIMRAYDVFDRGHLPRPSYFFIAKDGTIRVRHVFEDPAAIPDINEIMTAVRRVR
jgi:peroxiredoxin